MTTRSRILFAALIVALLPLTLLAAGARWTVRERLTAQYENAARAAATSVQRAITLRAAAIARDVAGVGSNVLRDAELRAAAVGTGDRSALIPYAEAAMRFAGLDFLLVLDSAGTVLSSGHFRNAYGRAVPALVRRAADDSVLLVRARRPADQVVALVVAHGYRVGRVPYTVVGGVAVDSTFLASLAPPSTVPLHVTFSTDVADVAAGAVILPFVDTDAGTQSRAGWVVSRSDEPLRAVLRAIDLWFAGALATAVLLAFVIARIVAARVNRPLEEITRQALRMNLRPDSAHFPTRRQDEVGTLARSLDTMVQRLRAAAAGLRDAERRATVGDMARQVNHDIRNGLLPIRNVIRHLGEVAEDSPAELARVFAERHGTLTGGIGYLESLATNYARLAPRIERQPCSVNAVIAEALQAAPEVVRVEPDAADPRVSADPVALRRIVENLVVNAVESLQPTGGRVVVRTAARADVVSVEVEDNGAGIPEAELERIFDDFHTTRDRGTGLGLSIVRRLVADMGGRISVDSEPSRGTTFTVQLPAAGR